MNGCASEGRVLDFSFSVHNGEKSVLFNLDATMFEIEGNTAKRGKLKGGAIATKDRLRRYSVTGSKFSLGF